MNNILIIGAGGHAISSIDIIKNTNSYKILGIIEKNSKIKSILNYKILGDDYKLEEIKKLCENAFIGIGHIKYPTSRIKIFNQLKKIGYNLPKIISCHSIVSEHSSISEATIIFNNVIIGPNSIIGFNSNA